MAHSLPTPPEQKKKCCRLLYVGVGGCHVAIRYVAIRHVDMQLDMLQLDMLHLRQFPCENTVTVLLLMDQMITVKKTGQKL